MAGCKLFRIILMGPALLIIVMPGELNAATRHVWTNSPAPAPPYTSWDTAAHDIQSAIEESVDGDVVLVTNGVYASGGKVVHGALTNRVSIDKAIQVLSVNGPEVTIIQGNGEFNYFDDAAVRCAYVGTNAILSGFTLQLGITRDNFGVVPAIDRNGGGAWCESTGVITNCVLRWNSAATHGGGVFGGLIYNCVIEENFALMHGGGAFTSTLSYCTILYNMSVDGGGGGAAASTLAHCQLMTNISSPSWLEIYGGGGAMDSTLSHCVVAGNISSGGGGGTWGGTLSHCILDGNIAYSDGGGSWYSTLQYCILSGNTAVEGDGGAAKYGTINNSFIFGNNAGSFGGGTYYANLVNCAVYDNESISGGGIAGGTHHNVTVTGNRAQLGGGVSFATLRNSIVYYNRAAGGENYYLSAFEYSCTTPPAEGEGNISSDPDLASFVHISSNSPCRHAGSSNFVSGVDIDGLPWNAIPSMGADEVNGAVTGSLSVTVTANFTNAAVGYPIHFTAWIEGKATHHEWQFADGASFTNRPYAVHSYLSPGTYATVVRVYNDSMADGVAATVTVHVAEQMMHYVNATNPSPSHPYGDWASAAVHIQEAVDAVSQAGAIIHVADGMYSPVVVNKPVTVRSENGQANAFIIGASNIAMRCVELGENAVLDGFTITNGYHGGVESHFSARVENSLITGSKSTVLAGSGVLGGRVDRCTISYNVGYHGGGAAYCALVNSVVIGNTATNFGFGGGVYWGVVDNCLIAYNRSVYSGGASACDIRNSTVVNNYGTTGGGISGSIVYNSIIHGNSNINQIVNYSWDCFISYSCTTPLPPGAGNISNDPMFVSSSDFRLAQGSPCIDSGNNDYALCLTDLDSDNRIVNGIVDMGAYEFLWDGDGDTDDDGMPDYWEIAYGLNPAVSNNSASNADDDWMTDLEEFIAGTDPTDGNSYFPYAEISGSDENLELIISQTVTGRVYGTYWSTNLMNAPQWWMPWGVEQTGTGSALLFTLPTELNETYLRTGVRLP